MSDSSTDSSDFSSDDELFELFENRPRPKNEDYLTFTVPQYNDALFFEHFRVSRTVANQIADSFKNSEFFNDTAGCYGKIGAYNNVLIFLWFAGHQTASFRDVGDRFNVTISSVYRVIRRVTYYLSSLSPEVIKWPTQTERNECEMHFRGNGFPGAIGAIDGSHIKIDKPEDDPESYINRKGYYSIQMQVVRDHKRRIRDVFIGYPGSVHDSRVFRSSPLFDSLSDKCGDLFILGDSAYPCLRHLLTPFKDRGHLTRQQRTYNTQLSKNRYVVEHCFGILKQKFRQLYHVKLRKIKDIVHFIRACCVLHNFAIDDSFQGNTEFLEENEVHIVNPEPAVEDNHDGMTFRNLVMNNL